MQISQEAKDALINAGTNRQAARVIAGSVAVFHELVDAGLITERTSSLTSKGTIARERAVTEALDKAFG
jgi:hypothetical protein